MAGRPARWRLRALHWGCVLACVATHGVNAWAWSVSVSPKDGEAGLARALESLRQARLAHPQDDAFKVVLEPGEYVLSAPLRIQPEHSGTGQVPTVVEARVPGSVQLVGAAPLALGRSAPNLWQFKPDVRADRAAERAAGDLFVNGTRAQLARHPNAPGTWFVNRAATDPDTAKSAFHVAASDQATLKALLEGQQDRAILSVMQSWTHSEHRISSLHADGELAVTPAAKWPFLFFGPNQRYAVLNVPGALDAPGEWLLDGGAVRYVPPPGQRAEGADARWPHVPTLMVVGPEGDSEAQVHDVVVQGIGFAYTGLPYALQGFVDTQAAVAVGAAIEVNQARRFTLRQCAVSHTAGHGIWFKHDVKDSAIERCVLNDLGAGGIRVGETQSFRDELATGNVRVVGNRVLYTGLRFPGAVGIWLGKTSGNLLQDNVVAHTTYSGMSIGWQWGYAESHSNANVVQGNALVDIGRGTLSDLGAIYTLGLAAGSQIADNFIQKVRDYPGYGGGGWGIYNDEGTSGMAVRNNVVVGTRSGGYHLHYGRNNVVEGNLFALGEDAEVRWSNVDRSGAWTLRRNGIVPQGSVALDARGSTAMVTQQQNTLGGPGSAALRVSAGARPGQVNVQGDPDLGGAIKAWRQVVAHAQSLLGDEGWGEPLAPVAWAAPTQRLALELQGAAPGTRPTTPLRMQPAQPPQAISVTTDTDGERCLMLQDGLPGLRPFEPYVHFPVEWPAVPTTLHVDLKPGVDANLVMEWRDLPGSAYNIGPTLAVVKGQLQVMGKPRMAVPPDQWLSLEVKHAGAGKGWSLRVRQGQGQAGWKDLGSYADRGPVSPTRWAWIGLYSNAEGNTRTCLRNLWVEQASP